jgi:autotransporter-associated beta strand protein
MSLSVRPHRNPRSARILNAIRIASLAVVGCASAAQAADLYYDLNGTTTGFGTTPGNWGTGSSVWNSDTTGGGAGSFTDTTGSGDNLFFSADSGTVVVTVLGAQNAGSLTLKDRGATINAGAAGSIVINNGSINNPAVNANRTFTIGAPITLSGTLTLTGAANTIVALNGVITQSGGPTTINLNSINEMRLGSAGNPTLSGTVNFNSGTTFLNADTAMGTAKAVFNGGSMRLSTTGAATRNLANNYEVNGDFTFLTAATFNGSVLNLNGTGTLGGGAGARTLGAGAAGRVVSLGGAVGDAGVGVGITVTGGGTLRLSGANTYRGDTRVAAGTLDVNNALALQNSTLNLASTDTGAVYFGNSTTSTPIAAATLAGIKGSRDLNAAAANLTLGNSLGINASYSGNLVTTGALTKSGTNRQVLSGSANSATGGVTVSGGSLVVNGGLTGSVSIAGGELGGTGTVTGAVTHTSGTINPGDGSIGTLQVDSLTASGGSVFAFDIGAGVDRLNVTGNLNASGLNAFTFNPVGTIAAGTYTLLSYGSLTGAIGNFSGPTTIGRNGLSYANTGSAITLTVSAPAAANWTPAAGGAYSVVGNWSGGYVPNQPGDVANFGSAATSPSTVTLSADVSPGALVFDNATTSYTVGAAGGSKVILDNLGGTGFLTVTSGSHTVAAPVQLTNGVTAIVDGNLTLSGGVAGTGGITKNGSGTLTLVGAASYSGNVAVNGGTLVGDSSNLLGSLSNSGTTVFQQSANGTFAGAISGTGTIRKAGTATLVISSSIGSQGLHVAEGTLDLNAATSVTPGSLTMGGGAAGTTAMLANASLLLGSDVNYVGTVDSGATIATPVALGAAGRTFTVADSSGATNDLTISGVVSGTQSLTKAGAGTLLLSATNTYGSATGATTVIGGTLKAGDARAIPGGLDSASAANRGVDVRAGTLDLNGFNYVQSTATSSRITIGNGGAGTTATIATGTGTLTLANSMNVQGTADGALSDGAVITGKLELGTANLVSVGSPVTFTNMRSFTVFNSTAAVDLEIAANTSSSTGGGLAKAGNGTLRLSGTNTFNYVAIGTGVVQVSADANLGAVPSTPSDVYGMSGGTLQFLSGFTVNANRTLVLYNVSNPVATPNIDTNGFDVTIAGAIRNISPTGPGGPAPIWKVGAGTLTLNGNNTGYAGTTSVIGGKLVAGTSTSLGTGGLDIQATGTAELAPGLTNAVVLKTLTIASPGSLQIRNNRLILDYVAGASPIEQVKNLIASSGIVSSFASPGSGNAIGYGEASALGLTTFGNVPVDADALLVLATRSGDATLDRVVNFDDLLKLAANYNQSGKTWTDGDFDASGNVNFDDLLILAANYNQGFSGEWALAQTLVPEPTALAGIALASSFVLGRRRRCAHR